MHAVRLTGRLAVDRRVDRQACRGTGRLAGGPTARHVAVKNCAEGRWKYYTCRFKIIQTCTVDVLTNKIHNMRTFSAPIYCNCELSLVNVAKFKRLLFQVHDMYNVNFNIPISQKYATGD
jgi:hypothetical protein